MARKSRILSPHGGRGIYHVISRVVDRRMMLAQAEDKEFFIHWMNAYAQFCGVRVLTYCVMDNHFHLLVDVPRFGEAEAQDLGDEELLRRLSFVSTEAQLQQWREWLEQSHGVGLATAQEKNEAQEDSHMLGSHREMRARLTRRMGDLGQFMKQLKGRFTQLYNRRHKRRGNLWECRYRSVLVGGSNRQERIEAVRTVAAYIDLNPIRAGLVSDPADYRWCGYAAALFAGKKKRALARAGIQAIRDIEDCDGSNQSSQRSRQRRWGRDLGWYRQQLFERGDERRNGPARERQGIAKAEVIKEQLRCGELQPNQWLSKRIRWMSESFFIGSKQYVEQSKRDFGEHFGQQRERTKLSAMAGCSKGVQVVGLSG